MEWSSESCSPFLGGGGAGARENANVDLGTDLLRGSRFFSWAGANFLQGIIKDKKVGVLA